METKISRKRGRPKLGNVLFARRVHPDRIPALIEALKAGGTSGQGGGGQKAVMVKETASVMFVDKPTGKIFSYSELEGQVKAAGDTIAVLDGRIKDLDAKLQRTARMTDDEKCRAWIAKYDRDIVKGRGEFSQE